MTILELCRLKKEDYDDEDDEQPDETVVFAIQVLAFSVDWRSWFFVRALRLTLGFV